MSVPSNHFPGQLPCGDTFCHPEFEDLVALFCPYRQFGCKKMSKSHSFPFHGEGLYNKTDAMSVVANPCLRQQGVLPPIIWTNTD